MLYHYRFPYLEANKQLRDIKFVDELNEIKSKYEQAIASAPKETIDSKSKFNGKPNDGFEEEEEEIQIDDNDLSVSEANLQRQNQ